MSLDTPLDVDVELDRLFARRSGADRVRMACEMFDCARSMALAAIRMQQPEIEGAALRLALFDRLYGDDYDDEQRAWLRRQLARGGAADVVAD